MRHRDRQEERQSPGFSKRKRLREIESELETETDTGITKVMHSFNKHSLSAHCKLSTILGAGDTEVNNTKCLLLKTP